jgi:hypothetical protein
MVTSTENAIKAAKTILVVRVTNKDVVPKYKKIQKKTILASTNLKLAGNVKAVLLGEFKPKRFNGLFSWQNTLVYDSEGNEKETQVIESLESGEEGSIESGQDWIVFLSEPKAKKAEKNLVFARAESGTSEARIVEILCGRKKLRSKLSKDQKTRCAKYKAR